jgi:hypothetical protein
MPAGILKHSPQYSKCCGESDLQVITSDPGRINSRETSYALAFDITLLLQAFSQKAAFHCVSL